MKTWDINKHSVILRDEFEFVGIVILLNFRGENDG